MKRMSVPFIGLIATLVAVVATGPATARRLTAIPGVRNESAGGTVTLPSMRSFVGDDDDEAKRSVRAKLKDGEAGTYIPEILLERDSALARWHDRPLVPVTVWVQSAPQLDDWNDYYVESVASAFRSWDAVELPIRFKVVAD